ncbi:hypothetical protein [Novosphingobium sediminicola]|uniref:DNA-binding protein n=1 Tax=Novosphingobium sediminicola TaxID=563162 RepID=A0A7W6G7Y3_9SPHN|nr:hypothetical protein [Novosphingobium sediminicola]MBB3956863.1 hypothetical protein [Novosphingobium sediminicola]
MTTKLASDADILRKVEDFCCLMGMGVTTFGRKAIGDPNLIPNMRNGRSLTLRNAARVLNFIAAYRPPHPLPRSTEKAA